MRIVVIDGQGGKMGRQLAERIGAAYPQAELTCVGTNAIATTAMLKAGAEPTWLGAQGMAGFMQADTAQWKKVAEFAKIVLE